MLRKNSMRADRGRNRNHADCTLLSAVFTLLIGIIAMPANAEGGWRVQTLESSHRFIDPLPMEVADSILMLPTGAGLEFYREDGGQWTHCGTLGMPNPSGTGLPQVVGPEVTITLRPVALDLSGEILAVVNLRPDPGGQFGAGERLEVFRRTGDSCAFEWHGETVWDRGKGMKVYHQTSVAITHGRIVLGDTPSKVLVFQNSPMGGWITKAELRPQSRSGPIEAEVRGLFGNDVSLTEGPEGELLIAVSDGRDAESIPPSGTVYRFDSAGEIVLRDKLYPPDSRPDDLFGADGELVGHTLRSKTRFFTVLKDGQLVEDAGSPLRPARLPSKQPVVSVAWSGDFAVLGAPLQFDVRKGAEYYKKHIGKAYAFVRTESGWQELPPLTPASGASHDFGRRVAVWNGHVFVADPERKQVTVFTWVPSP